MQLSKAEEQLIEVNKEIKALIHSEEYKELTRKNHGWAVLAPTNHEKGEWELLKEKLMKLEEDKKFWQKVMLNITASYVQKQDPIRKEYKKKSVPKSSRDFLITIAKHLYSIYRFPLRFDHPSFGDVKEAAGFKNTKDVFNYFSARVNLKTSTDSNHDVIQNFFSQAQWIYFLDLNAQLHGGLTMTNDITTILLPPSAFQPKLVQDVLEKIGFDPTHFDIKEGNSDSSTGGSPTTDN
ncbi:hypothetical protein HMI54_010304 [Coelomomyces lativittatus]|nr:hypothetical protein HMI56_004900 [Coelomomyces lativittatus]KAJ1501021.1 hypothetical protein HMI54_010304 [Coelomomyces lativittatus]KAJ1515106.1 hypothetical protein HMI55_004035 [Coelomomyces lativittatus]